MATKTLFHSTSWESWQGIKENGFDPLEEKQSWNCSNSSEMYFYDMDKNGNEHEDKHGFISDAFGSGAIAAAIQGSNDSRLVVIEIEIDDRCCEDDSSAPNMEDVATVVHMDDLNEHATIKAVHISNDYLPGMRFFYLPCSRPAFGQLLNIDCFSEVERKAYEMISSSEMFFEDLLYFEWDSEMIEIDFGQAV